MADSLDHFDFDYWSALAKRDPAAFFAARQQLIDEFIDAAPVQHRQALRVLQDMIDGARAEACSPLHATRQMMSMIGDHLQAMQAQLLCLHDESAQLAAALSKI
ncbi:MAG TPA: DUF3135 domain-containing protein [Rhodocyclaceae bacterium]|nr:DUF3135 domain-containing protein [Rhodocyclaceae bacterium]